MIIFKHKRKNKYLISNYKVMFSTLVNQPNLERANKKSFVLQTILKSIHICPRTSIHFLIRNPEHRLLSFFHNKFRQYIHKTEFSEWEHCQQIFFKHLGILESDPPKLIKEKILNFTYEQFIQSLPTHYQKDAHLLPQSYMSDLSILGFKIPFKFKPDAVYIMEKEADLKKLANTFDLNLSIKKNASEKDSTQITLPIDLKQIIESIYATDNKMYKEWS